MKRVYLAIAVALALGVAGYAGAAGEWLREGPVWLKGLVYSGTSRVALTNAAGNLSTTSGAFSSTLSVTGASTLTGAVSAASTLSVSGATTLASTLKLTSAGTFGATGTTGGNGTALTAVVAGVTSPTNVAAVVLPQAATGLVQIVGVVGATNGKLYPYPGQSINASSADTALSISSGKSYVCAAYTGAAWLCAGN